MGPSNYHRVLWCDGPHALHQHQADVVRTRAVLLHVLPHARPHFRRAHQPCHQSWSLHLATQVYRKLMLPGAAYHSLSTWKPVRPCFWFLTARESANSQHVPAKVLLRSGCQRHGATDPNADLRPTSLWTSYARGDHRFFDLHDDCSLLQAFLIPLPLRQSRRRHPNPRCTHWHLPNLRRNIRQRPQPSNCAREHSLVKPHVLIRLEGIMEPVDL